MSKNKEYLGDGLYASFDGYHIALTAENGVYATATVYLDPHVLNAFFDYVERIKNASIANQRS